MQLLQNDPNKRMSLEAFLANDWVQGKTASTCLLASSQKRLQMHISAKK